MGLIDFILNLAGILLWMSWRSIRFDPLVQATPASLVGTLRRTEPRRTRGWQLLAGLAALLFLRALLYWQIGPEADWTPKLGLFFVVLPFRSHLFLPSLLFSVMSFMQILVICYFWALALVVINRQAPTSDPLLKLLRLHLGPAARWPWPLQSSLPLLLVALLWLALHPLLVRLEIINRVTTNAHLAGQGLLIGAALYLTLQYLLPVILFAYLIISYVYLGTNPFWDFVGNTARNLLTPIHRLPLRFARFDFTPIAGAVLILLLLHWLPDFILHKLGQHHASLWPQ